jgi:hypothetical protein
MQKLSGNEFRNKGWIGKLTPRGQELLAKLGKPVMLSPLATEAEVGKATNEQMLLRFQFLFETGVMTHGTDPVPLLALLEKIFPTEMVQLPSVGKKATLTASDLFVLFSFAFGGEYKSDSSACRAFIKSEYALETYGRSGLKMETVRRNLSYVKRLLRGEVKPGDINFVQRTFLFVTMSVMEDLSFGIDMDIQIGCKERLAVYRQLHNQARKGRNIKTIDLFLLNVMHTIHNLQDNKAGNEVARRISAKLCLDKLADPET